MDKQHSVLVIGGSDAGKTNYILRLWLSIKDSSGLLQSDGLPDELEYLRSGVENLLTGKYAKHTAHDVHNRITIPFKHVSTNTLSGNLVVPDRAGEKWMEIYRKREWSKDWEDIISETCGCLLFIRADSEAIIPSIDWISCEKLYGTLGTNSLEIKDIPSEVVMIDWLQCLRAVFTDIVASSFRPRIGIVIAAWDLVPDDQKELDPDHYLKNNFPMLNQFVKANYDEFEFATFGISITGGDLNDAAGFKKEFLQSDPRKAGYVYHKVNQSFSKANDITIPAAWAIGITPK